MGHLSTSNQNKIEVHHQILSSHLKNKLKISFKLVHKIINSRSKNNTDMQVKPSLRYTEVFFEHIPHKNNLTLSEKEAQLAVSQVTSPLSPSPLPPRLSLLCNSLPWIYLKAICSVTPGSSLVIFWWQQFAKDQKEPRRQGWNVHRIRRVKCYSVASTPQNDNYSLIVRNLDKAE